MHGIVNKLRATALNYSLFTKCTFGLALHSHGLCIVNRYSSSAFLIDKYTVFMCVCILAIY